MAFGPRLEADERRPVISLLSVVHCSESSGSLEAVKEGVHVPLHQRQTLSRIGADLQDGTMATLARARLTKFLEIRRTRR